MHIHFQIGQSITVSIENNETGRLSRISGAAWYRSISHPQASFTEELIGSGRDFNIYK